tara:strand:+ start:171 stop:773 length:603 start_codon:yes stop_codon:yes gene_type:complete
MTLSRDKYVPNSTENIEKLVRKVMEGMDFDTMWQSAYQGLTNHYTDQDQCFVEDYYETFPDEDPELNGVQEEEDVDKIVYYHGHSNPCVVGEIYIPRKHGDEVISITHNMVYELYGDNLCDITKIRDANVQIESTGRDRYDTDYDSCIHIPLDMGEHTTLANKVFKQILLNKGVELVKIQYDGNQLTLDEFFTKCLGLKG